MKISDNMVATISYRVSDMEGKVLESSETNGKLAYIHGMQFLSPGMESALEGKEAGEKIDSELKAAEAFGEYSEAMLFSIPRKDFPVNDEELNVGLEFQAEIKGDVRFCRVEKIEGDVITINANHPYAGIDVRFEAEVHDVREATSEEIDHGHVHGEGGHAHH